MIKDYQIRAYALQCATEFGTKSANSSSPSLRALIGTSLPIDEVFNRQWPFRRILARIAAGMRDEQLKQLVRQAWSLAQ